MWNLHCSIQSFHTAARGLLSVIYVILAAFCEDETSSWEHIITQLPWSCEHVISQLHVDFIVPHLPLTGFITNWHLLCKYIHMNITQRLIDRLSARTENIPLKYLSVYNFTFLYMIPDQYMMKLIG